MSVEVHKIGKNPMNQRIEASIYCTEIQRLESTLFKVWRLQLCFTLLDKFIQAGGRSSQQW